MLDHGNESYPSKQEKKDPRLGGVTTKIILICQTKTPMDFLRERVRVE